MELVYLWVEEYKNIYRQGFNFSPRFECKFENNKLTIIEKDKDEYIENFFDKKGNINITAIVGKNGSGKSSIVKLIYLLYFLHFCRKNQNTFWGDDTEKTEQHIHNLYNILTLNKNTNCFLVLKKEKTFFKIDINFLKKQLIDNGFDTIGEEYNIKELDILYLGKRLENFDDEISVFNTYLNYSIDTLKNNIFEGWIEELYHRQDNYTLPLLIEPAKYDNKIDISLLKTIFNQRVLLFYQKIKTHNIGNITNFFNPNLLKFSYQEIAYNTKYKELIKKNERYKIIIKYLDWLKAKENNSIILIHGNSNHKCLSNIYEFYKNNNFKELNILYLSFKLIENKEIVTQGLIDSLNNALEHCDIKKIEKLLKNYIKNKSIFKPKKNTKNYKNYKILQSIKFYIEEYHRILEKFHSKTIPLHDIPDDILNIFPAWLHVEILESQKSLSSLSTGEKFKFFFIISLLYQLENLQNTSYNSINLYLDEIEMGFHPEWQRSFLKELLFALKNYSKPINLYFLTHSPFLLSDIPKQNIIFLDTYKKEDEEVKSGKQKVGNCKVVDGLNDKKETFGANIHTLLSDSFFMENGLMGEFAKGKIESIRKFYNKVIKYKDNNKVKKAYKCFYEKKQKEFWDIQSIIGEPFLQKIVKNQLEEIELILLGKNDAIDKEIARLQALKESFNNDQY